MDTHKFLVHQLSQEIKSFHSHSRPFTIYHGTSTYSSRAPPNPRAVVHTTALNNILDINTSSNFVMVEPNVSMRKLLHATLKHGLMPPIVPLFLGLTVGGCFTGTVGSSASGKYGWFDETVLWCEVVMATGKVERASRTRNVELFGGLVGTRGTIGVVTLLQIRLVPAVKWVEVRYLPVKSKVELLKTITELVRDEDNDFVEGFVGGSEAWSYGVIAVGKLSAEKEYPEVTFSAARDDWFYQHALEAGKRTESIPMMDYLFRHDRGAFALGKQCFGRVPCNKWTRWITGGATHSRALMKSFRALHWADHVVVQDVVVPLETSSELLGYLEKEVKIYPIQLIPCRQKADENLVTRTNPLKTDLAFSVTIRGSTPDTIHNPHTFASLHRHLENTVHRLGGFKCLHSRNCYTEKEFWETYPRQKYEELRETYGAGYLHDLWQKSRVHEKTRLVTKGRMRRRKVEGFWNRVWGRVGVVAIEGDG